MMTAGLQEVTGMNDKSTFRNAGRKDTALILGFIKELADEEKMLEEVVADEETLKHGGNE